MSSILDALKKLEEEKAAQAAPQEFEADTAEQELVRGGRRSQVTIQLSPVTALAIIGVLLTGAAAVFVAQYKFGTHVAETTTSVQTPVTAPPKPTQPAPETAAVKPTPTPPVESAPVVHEETAPAVREDPAPTVVTHAAKPAPGSAASHEPPARKPASQEASAKASPVKPPAPPDELPSVTREVPASVATAPAKPAAPATFDMYSLPILTETDKDRLGLKGMVVNMLRSPSKNRPNPSAIINLQPVYVNEVIQGTKAKLIGVDIRGIAIEVGGERFFVRK